MTIEKRSPTRRTSHAPVAALLIVLIVAATTVEIFAIYRRTADGALSRANFAASAAAIYAGQVFGAVSLALQSIDGDPNSPAIVIRGSPTEVLATLKRAQTASPVMQGLGYVDANGRVVVNATSLTPPASDLSDRPYFITHRDNRDPSLLIGRPVVSRPDNSVSITMSRRVETADGEFAGIVASRLDPGYFAAFFAKLDATAISLVDRDGVLYARHPSVDLIAAAPRPLPANPDGGRFEIAIPGDVLIGFAVPVPGTNLFVRAVSSRNEMIATWVRRASIPVLGACIAIIAVLVATVSLRRRFERMLALASEREAAAVEAREDAAHFRSVARNKSDFLAQMGHEIRTPINAIVGFADVIATDAMKLGAPQRYREYAADIRFSADHLLAIINSILDMSKIEAGKWKLALGDVDSAHVLSTVRHLAQQRAAKEGVTLRIDESAGNVSFVADERVVVQILLNLTINAIKFAGEDRLVRLGCGPAPGERIEFEVADSGRGMTADQARRVLEPFETAGDGDRRSDTGLGLPLSLMFARLHGGTIEIDTAPAKGTRVRLLLPVRGPQPAATAA